MVDGALIALVGVIVVFALMVFMMAFITLSGRLLSPEPSAHPKELPNKSQDEELNGAHIAAIAAALHLATGRRARIVEVKRSPTASWRRGS